MKRNRKKVIDLEKFIRIGTFGELKFGMSGQDILKLFGEPDRVGALPDDEIDCMKISMDGSSKLVRAVKKVNKFHASIWVYGDIELHFKEPAENLWMIYSDYFKGRLHGGSKLKILRTRFVKGQIPFCKIRKELENANIPFKSKQLDNNTKTKIKLESGVELHFINEKGNGFLPGLISISFAAESN